MLVSMYPILILCVFLMIHIQFLSCTPQLLAESVKPSTATTLEFIQRYNYPVETHNVQTSDGYILTMYRIPRSPKTSTNNTNVRPVAFMMHGLIASSSDWVFLGPERSLAFILSDAGYDIWLGNARGNKYSKKHIHLSTESSEFWSFSWHEIGVYDLPAMIDYAMNATGQSQVHYIGHSQGTTTFLVLTSVVPSYNSRIRSAHLLAPVGYMNHMSSPLSAIDAPLRGNPTALAALLGNNEFLPSSALIQLLGQVACKDKSPVQVICTDIVFLIFGWGSPFSNETAIPEIAAIYPSGSSSTQIEHYLQEYNSGYFRQFDHGLIQNLLKYHSIQPPNYQISNIVAPVYTYYGDNDAFVSIIDVQRLHAELNVGTLKGTFELPHGWNHLDFIAGINASDILYTKVIADLNRS